MAKPTPWLTDLNSEDIEITADALNSSQSKLRRAHPGEQAMWFEIMDLCDDLHASWEVVWPAEHAKDPF